MIYLLQRRSKRLRTPTPNDTRLSQMPLSNSRNSENLINVALAMPVFIENASSPSSNIKIM